MAVAFVGQAADNGFQEPVTVSYASTGGNLLILCVHHHGSSTSPTITDSAGNTWLVAGATTSATGNEGRGTMYYCLNASAITSVTIPQQGSAVAANIDEWSGVASFRGASTGYDQFPSSFRVPTTAAAGDMVISQASVWAQNGTPPTPSAGWTALTVGGTGSNYIAAAYELGSVGGSRGPTFTMPSGVGKFGIVTAAFVPAASATQHPASGTAAAVTSASATVAARRVVAGVAAAVTAATGAVTARRRATGGVAASTAAAGTATALLPTAGSAAAITGGSGTATALLPAAGSVPSTSAAVGSVTALLPATGLAAGVSGASGSAALLEGTDTFPASGTAASISGASGEVTVLLAAAGTAEAVSGASGSAVITEQQQGGIPIDITILSWTVPTTGWEANGPTTGWSATKPTAAEITGTAPTTGWSATPPEVNDMPITNGTSIRADSTEFWKATITADHDITGKTIEIAFPPKGAAVTTWYPTTVDSVAEATPGKWTATFRILVGPNGGDVTLTGGAAVDVAYRLTEGLPPAERPTFKVATITGTDT